MQQTEPALLLDRLLVSARLWAAATGRSLGALASVVVNHGSFFERLESPGASTTTATLEKFARFLVDPANWPDGAVPGEVAAFGHVTGISNGATLGDGGDTLRLPPLSRGKDGESSPGTSACSLCERRWEDIGTRDCSDAGCPRRVAA